MISWKEGFLFLLGGALYYGLEMAYRGFSHWTLFLLGGACFLYASMQNEKEQWDTPLWLQLAKVEAVVVVGEFLVGCVVNLILGWNVWDYSDLPFQIMGQTSLEYILLFLPLCLLAILLDDYIRYFFFGEEKPRYVLFKKKK